MTIPRITHQLNVPYDTAGIKKRKENSRRYARETKGKVRVLSIPGQKAKDLKAQRLAEAAMLNDFARLVKENQLGMDPWEHLPGETDLSYERFSHYLMQQRLPHLNNKRSYDRVAKQFGIRSQTVSEMADKWHWKLRAKCYDVEIERQEHEAFVEERRANVRKQARLGGKLQQLALIGAENMIATRALDLTPSDVARLADTGVKIERLAHGDATSHEARQTETRVIWDGPTPKWANRSTEVVPLQQQRSLTEESDRADEDTIRQRVRDLTTRKEDGSDPE